MLDEESFLQEVHPPLKSIVASAYVLGSFASTSTVFPLLYVN